VVSVWSMPSHTNLEKMSQTRVSITEAQEQYGDPEEMECPPLETITRRLVNTVNEDTVHVDMCVCVCVCVCTCMCVPLRACECVCVCMCIQ
jgi:hypothetical protein